MSKETERKKFNFAACQQDINDRFPFRNNHLKGAWKRMRSAKQLALGPRYYLSTKGHHIEAVYLVSIEKWVTTSWNMADLRTAGLYLPTDTLILDNVHLSDVLNKGAVAVTKGKLGL